MSERSDYRKLARGQACTLRVAGYMQCSGTDTTVFCHAPSGSHGMGLKSEHWWGAFACHKCHQLIDKQAKLLAPRARDCPAIWGGKEVTGVYLTHKQRHLTREEIAEAWLRAIHETQKALGVFK